MDYQSKTKQNAFATAALVMGILSLVSLCTFIGPLVFGSLGIIFGVLSRRPNQKTATETIVGLITSGIGCVISLVLSAGVLFSAFSMLTDPDYRQELNETSEKVYGVTFDEMVEEIYGYTFDELLEEMNYE